jgi:hypothetical protein
MSAVTAPAPASQGFSSRVSTLFSNLLNRTLNLVFGLTHNAAGLRSTLVGVAFFCIWMILAFTVLPADQYSLLLNTLIAAAQGGDSAGLVTAATQFILTVFLHPVVVRHLLALYVPFWMMHRISAIYLADIFEKDEMVSREFILQAAFAASYRTIHIRQGKVAESDQDSPMIAIGGPGNVVVELDSAVLFERPDGTTHIIGPTIDGRGRTVIEGFERIRQGFDLRDVTDKQDVTTRSRDGILVTAKDIQYSYSLYRGPKPEKSLRLPYPYDPGALEALVYSPPRMVKPDFAPSRQHDWQSPLPGKIAGQIIAEMGGFISKRGLSEFLATIGLPEEKSLFDREKDIDERSRAISGVEKDGPGEAPLKGGDFVPRSVLTKMFHESFQSKAPNRGSYLNWIGVGTWETPRQIILDNHREAWKISRENFALGNLEELKKVRNEAKLQEWLRLIQEGPVKKFYEEYKFYNNDEIVPMLLREYREILENACEIYRQDIVPLEISNALQEILFWLSGFHSIGDVDTVETNENV